MLERDLLAEVAPGEAQDRRVLDCGVEFVRVGQDVERLAGRGPLLHPGVALERVPRDVAVGGGVESRAGPVRHVAAAR